MQKVAALDLQLQALQLAEADLGCDRPGESSKVSRLMSQSAQGGVQSCGSPPAAGSEKTRGAQKTTPTFPSNILAACSQLIC
eukprot:2771525-Amphidinium_carterae.1